MQLPVMRGLIARRLLVNYRVAPEVVAAILPAPFRPKLAGGYAVAGICLIRLEQIRPDFMPAFVGLASENAAHRIAVEWTGLDGRPREGVYIPRRDTSSRLNTVVGGRLFPGMHNHASFSTESRSDRLRIAFTSDDGVVAVAVEGQVAGALPPGSVFATLDEASRFFEAGSVGYSATHDPHLLDGLELRSQGWRVEPFAVTHAASSFFEDRTRFPAGTVELDCALLMRSIPHEWHRRESLAIGAAGEVPQAQ
ncbi:MAG: DUF2071 domain-containing protein [Roseiflexaceae bacterium]